MSKLVKILMYLLGVFVLIIIGGYIYITSFLPSTDPPPDVTVEITEERIKRGEYLAYNVASCIDCHSERDWTKFSGPPIAGTFGGGGEVFDESMGFPGSVAAKNITPAALKDWTDGEIIRAVTMGVNKKGEALFPIMPYHNFNQLSEEDLYSIIAYIRMLEPIEREIPERKLNFPLNLIVNTMPIKTYTPKQSPDKNDIVAYGKYLTTIASCSDCHTPSVKGEPIPGMEFAGGMEFQLPSGLVSSMNITPDKETGIGNWTKEDFLKRFRDQLPDSLGNYREVNPMKDFFTPMPWAIYAEMTDEDLTAIFEYLKTVKPVSNKVEFFQAGKVKF